MKRGWGEKKERVEKKGEIYSNIPVTKERFASEILGCEPKGGRYVLFLWKFFSRFLPVVLIIT